LTVSFLTSKNKKKNMRNNFTGSETVKIGGQIEQNLYFVKYIIYLKVLQMRILFPYN